MRGDFFDRHKPVSFGHFSSIPTFTQTNFSLKIFHPPRQTLPRRFTQIDDLLAREVK
jgi:hypothetical protein